MAALQQPFNAQAIAPDQGGNFQQLPLGTHPVRIVASEVKPTKDNTGGMVVFELEVIGGPNQGATGSMNLNLYNQSDKARAIAEGQLSALCHATGVFMLQDTQQLHNLPFAVLVTEQPLTAQQQEKKANGENVTPFTQVKKILMPDGSEVKGGGGQPQNAQQGVQTGNAWAGNGAAQSPAPSPAPAPAAGSNAWGGGQAQAPAQAPAQQGNAWSQGGAAGGAPAWGKK